MSDNKGKSEPEEPTEEGDDSPDLPSQEIMVEMVPQYVDAYAFGARLVRDMIKESTGKDVGSQAFDEAIAKALASVYPPQLIMLTGRAQALLILAADGAYRLYKEDRVDSA